MKRTDADRSLHRAVVVALCCSALAAGPAPLRAGYLNTEVNNMFNSLGAIGNLQVHQQMLTSRVCEQRAELASIHLEILRSEICRVDHRRDETLGLDLLHRVASFGCSRLSREFKLFRHGN